MKLDKKNKTNIKSILHLISTIISWTVFVLLVICCILLVYYFISVEIYKAKGSGYEPKYSLYTIVSPSMVPNINVYDVIIDTKVESPEDIEIGDVITYNSSITGVSGTITHRVIAITKDSEGNYYYRTKGDNNLVDDGVDISYSSVVGKVVIRIPQLGKVQSFVSTSYGWLLLILIPALYIIVKDILRIVRIKVEESTQGGPSKLRDLFTKPLLSYRPRKALPTPEDINISKEDSKLLEDTIYEEVNTELDKVINESTEEVHDEKVSNDIFSYEETKEETKPGIDFFNEDDEDIDIDDLPKLK